MYIGPVYFFSAPEACQVAFVQPPRADGKQEIWPCRAVHEADDGLHSFMQPLEPATLGELGTGTTKAGTLLLSVDEQGFYHVNPLASDVSCYLLTVQT